MWVPDGPLPGLCHLFADGRVFGGRVSCLGLCLARTLLLEFVHLTYPLAYRVGIVERNAGTLCQLDSSPGIASGGLPPRPPRTCGAALRRRLPAQACCSRVSDSSCTVRRHARPGGSRRCRRLDPLLPRAPSPDVPSP